MDIELEDEDFDVNKHSVISAWINTHTDLLFFFLHKRSQTFQAQLFALTGVPVDRQKVMSKGKMVKVMHEHLRACQNCSFRSP